MESLWGEEFTVEDTKEKAKKIKAKVLKPKVVSVEKVAQSKSVSIEDKLKVIGPEVHRILGKFADNIIVIRTKEEFKKYIDKSIENGIISIDTETNNSLDPLTCKLMGPCIYTPGEKYVYIPINHTDLEGNLLENQLTEADVKELFDRLSNTKIIMHNAKFDYQVIKCTCNCELKVYWDCFIGARLLNENEKAGLKIQYISKIDQSIEKYDIENMFKKLPYNYVDPELFSLYAATDAYITYELYKYQLKEFSRPEYKNLFNLFMTVEMPVMYVAAAMELTGVSIDLTYARKLSTKYNKLLDEKQRAIDKEIEKLNPLIETWKSSPEANEKPKVYAEEDSVKKILEYENVFKLDPTAKSVYSYDECQKEYKKFSNKDSRGYYKEGKSKADQLEIPLNTSSTTLLAILLYDILKAPVIDQEHPRGTGEDIMEQLSAKFPICKTILAKRSLAVLVSTFIDKLPESVSKADNRLHGSFLLLGTDTGRFSSKDPNLQNIPSDDHSIRCMFVATQGEERDIEFDDYFDAYVNSEVKLNDGSFKKIDNLTLSDILEDNLRILKIDFIDDNHRRIYCE